MLFFVCINVEKVGDLFGGGVFFSSLVEIFKCVSIFEVGIINYVDFYK